MSSYVFFFQAEDGIRDLVRSRGLGDVYKRQVQVGIAAQFQRSLADGADEQVDEAVVEAHGGVGAGSQDISSPTSEAGSAKSSGTTQTCVAPKGAGSVSVPYTHLTLPPGDLV